MKLLLLLLAFGVLLTVEARAKGPKRPVESEEDDVVEEAPAASGEGEGEDGGDDEGEAEVKSDTGSSCAKNLSMDEQIAFAKAKERTCSELLKLIKKNEKKNERPTPKQKEIREECLNRYTAQFLNRIGKYELNIRKIYPTDKLRKYIRKLPKTPCVKEDKIIDFGVGFVRGEY